jgi:outer membrane lipoprotein SlyB
MPSLMGDPDMTSNAFAPVLRYARLIAAAALVGTSAACAAGLGVGDYPRAQAGRPARVEEGVIERVRPVTIEGTRTIIGPASGAAIGGLLGSEVGGGDEERAIMAIAGAVLGGLAGAAVEEGVTRRTGYAYTIRMANGELINIVQADQYPLSPGQPVYLEYAARVRVTPR